MAAPTTAGVPKGTTSAGFGDPLTMIQIGLASLSKTSKSVSDAFLSPQARASVKSKLAKFATEKPYLASFLLSQVAISGLPVVFSIALLVAVGIFALAAGVLLGVIGALLFVLFATCVTVCCLLPTLLLTTFAAVAVWLWGAGAFFLMKYLNNDEPTGSRVGPTTHGPPNAVRTAISGPTPPKGQAPAPGSQNSTAPRPNPPGNTQAGPPPPTGAWKPAGAVTNGAPAQLGTSTPAAPPAKPPAPPSQAPAPPPAAPANTTSAPKPQQPAPPSTQPPPTQTQTSSAKPAADTQASQNNSGQQNGPRRDSMVSRKPVSRPSSPDRDPDQRAPSQIRRKPVSRPASPVQEDKPRSTSAASINRKPVGGAANGAPRQTPQSGS